MPVAGATSATLTIPAVTPADLGDYTLTVSNGCGGLTVGPFTLSVESTAPVAPVITAMEFLKGNFQLTFASKEGLNYVVEYKNQLDDSEWTPIATVTGDGQEQQIVDTPPPCARGPRARPSAPPARSRTPAARSRAPPRARGWPRARGSR